MRSILFATVVFFWSLSIVACSSARAPSAPPASAPKPAPSAVAPSASTGAEQAFENLNPNNFARSTNITNEWFPMKPGMQFVFEGYTTDGTQAAHRRLVFVVTDLTKVIAGVRTVVAWIVDYSNDKIVEKEIAFYAQENDGTVWYLGEYPEEYENDKFLKAPTWIHGLDDAKAGIQMRAKPQLGLPSYSAGWGPRVGFTDRARIEQVGQRVSVPYANYPDVIMIAETSQVESSAFQLKYYARGVGKIRVGWRGADASQETLELVDLVQLSPQVLAQIRAEALALEKRAYEYSKNMYGQTAPMEAAK